MNCQEFLRLHSEFLDERLTPSDADRAQVHITICASCARYDRIVRRAQIAVRRLPPTPVSPDFRARLEQRVLRERDEVFVARTGAGAGVALSLAMAGLLALAAWGPLLRADGAMRADLVMESSGAYQAPAVDPGGLPSPDWWDAPNVGRAFSGYMRPPRQTQLAFPGPYSPLIVMPPVAGRRGGAMSSLPAHLTSLD